MVCSDANCVRCSSAGTCTECKQNFWLDCANNCVTCGDGFVGYCDGVDRCEECPENCKKCTRSESGHLLTCTVCNHGFYLLTDGTCSACGEEDRKVMIWKSGVDAKCFVCTDDNCKRCGLFNEGICLECKTDFYIQYSSRHTATNNCVDCNNDPTTQTKVGLYCLNSNDCTANCKKCLNIYECGICTTGYFLTCSNTCQPCPNECEDCTETECTKCKSDYSILDGFCVPSDCDNGFTSLGGWGKIN